MLCLIISNPAGLQFATSGIPQGSVLDPYFLLCMLANDIPAFLIRSDVYLFVDDIKL